MYIFNAILYFSDADSPLKPYYSSRRRRSPSNPISKSPKQIEQKDIRPHVNPAVIKLLHVLNKRQQKIQPISSNNNVHHHDYSPNCKFKSENFDYFMEGKIEPYVRGSKICLGNMKT